MVLGYIYTRAHAYGVCGPEAACVQEWNANDRSTCLASAVSHVFEKLKEEGKKMAQVSDS